ncbi:MAG TPA: MFS transporter [Pseudonocardiaceae bacterium]|nr:MFS transporter [Pseudonocardiaceae bacterium]
MLRAGLRSRSFQLMLATSLVGFGGYGMLLPIVPLWAALGGAGEFGAGMTTGVFMLATVGTQFVVPALLRRLGHRPVLMLGMLLLGGPAPLYALSADLPLLLGVSLVRGVGFGLVTVAGSALIAELVPSAEHGRAAARYGFAVGLPQLVLLPSGVVIAEQVGFGPLFTLAGTLPVAGAVLVLGIRVPPGRELSPRESAHRDPAQRPGPAQDWRAVRSSAGPWLAMLTCSMAQGGVITFLPLAMPRAGVLVPVALLATTAGTLVGRLLAGELIDRWGLAGRLLVVGMLLAVAGTAAEVVAVHSSGGLRTAAAVVGAALVGIGFGVVQNDSLVMMFAAAGASGYGAASAAWNIGYDAGTGLGAVVLGAAAQQLGFAAAFATSAVLLAMMLPAAARTRRQAPAGTMQAWHPRR